MTEGFLGVDVAVYFSESCGDVLLTWGSFSAILKVFRNQDFEQRKTKNARQQRNFAGREGWVYKVPDTMMSIL